MALYKQPWHTLNIDISDAVRKDFDFDKLFNESEFKDGPAGIWHFMRDKVNQMINQEWIDKMHEKGLMVQSAMVFHRKPHYVHPSAHVDLFWDGGLCTCAINWVLDPLDDSEMVWYDVPLETGTHEITAAQTKYIYWPNEELDGKMFSSRTIGTTPTLVNVGIPHNIIVKERPRWVISLRIGKTEPKSWDDALELFKPYIIE